MTTLHTFHETPNVLIENKEDCTFYSGEMTRPLENSARKSIDISSTQIRVEKWLENFHIETCVTTTLLPFLMMLSYSTELESLKVEDIYLTDTSNTYSFLSEFSEGTIHIEPFVYYAKQKSFVLHFSKDHFNITLNDVRIYIEKHQLQKYVLHQHRSLFTHLRWVVWQSKVKRKTKNNN